MPESYTVFQQKFEGMCAVQIVYVAPMKALAAEMVRNFGQRLSALAITVQELTGDMQLSKSEIMKTQVQFCGSMFCIMSQ